VKEETEEEEAKFEIEEEEAKFAAAHSHLEGQGGHIAQETQHVCRNLRQGEGAEGNGEREREREGGGGGERERGGGEHEGGGGTGGSITAGPCIAIKLRIGVKHYRRRVQSLYQLEEVVRQKLRMSGDAGVAGGGEMGAGAQGGAGACGHFELTYVDCDGDVITVGSEAEFQEAAYIMQGEGLKLTVMPTDQH